MFLAWNDNLGGITDKYESRIEELPRKSLRGNTRQEAASLLLQRQRKRADRSRSHAYLRPLSAQIYAFRPSEPDARRDASGSRVVHYSCGFA
jgi:hypothetical protein